MSQHEMYRQLQLQQFGLPNGNSNGDGVSNGTGAATGYTAVEPQYQQYRPSMPLEIDPAHAHAGESLLAFLASGSPHGKEELMSNSPAAAAHRTNVAIERYLNSREAGSGTVNASDSINGSGIIGSIYFLLRSLDWNSNAFRNV